MLSSQKKQKRQELARCETDYLRMRRTRLNNQAFTFIKTIGRGAFGEVSQ